MKTIAIVTPNTDTFTNPTMTALFHIMNEQDIKVFVFGPTQQPGCPDNLPNVTLIPSVFRLNLFKNPKHFKAHWSSYVRVVQLMRRKKIKTLLAVDPLGLIVGGRLKKMLGGKIHLSYLSFEIFFKQELSGHYFRLKEKEVKYSNLIDSLMVQDPKRCELIKKENGITLSDDKIALVPVSPQRITIDTKSDIHSKLGIPSDKKIVVYSGSVGEWCGTHAIIEAFDKGYWSSDYWLVFHTRKIIREGEQFSSDLHRLDSDESKPFSLHPNPFDSFEDLSAFLSGFDAALALYYPNTDNPYYGINMKEIGLSSGKFSTYMMLGLPTVVTPCSVYEDLLQSYRFGAILHDISEISLLLDRLVTQGNDAYTLYDEVLNPDKLLREYMNIIKLNL